LLKRFLKEPLLHFFTLGLVIFAAYGIVGPTGTGKPDNVVVTTSKIEQLASVFVLTWQRPPSAGELKGLIDDHVKEEIYSREALALGLDKDDPVIRRRLRQKMEFVNEAGIDAVVPTDADLETYLRAHLAEFESEPMMALQQVFLNPQRHGDTIEQDAAAIQNTLQANPTADLTTFGDVTLLPSDLPLTSKTAVAQTFGPEFADALDKVSPGEWTGPIRSGFGLHIVRVSKRQPAGFPELSEMHDAVVQKWRNDKRKERDEAKFGEILKRYLVTVENPAATGPTR
jgi:hypothetical protein